MKAAAVARAALFASLTVAVGRGWADREPPPATPDAAAKKPDGSELANGKLKISTLFYADWGYYYKTGFGPPFLTQLNPPGPGNDGFNSFDVTRGYLNFFFLPNEAFTLRITPNIYRQIGAAPATKVGAVSGVAANTDGELAFRLKYAYLDVNRIFPKGSALGKSRLTLGQQFNPLIDWEENLHGFRYVSLVPWNYLSLSSTQTGIALQGPVEFSGKQYVEYSIGVFTNASFRQLEQGEKKQFMARASVFPMGAASRFQGLGLTGFVDYAHSNVAPDTQASIPVHRLAAIAHYTTRSNSFGIAAEADFGRNAFTSGNLFSGSGPQDEFGAGTTPYAAFDAVAKTTLNVNGARERSYAAFGHLAIPNSRFTVFGMFHMMNPNIDANPNSLDFRRVVAGVQYKQGDRLRFALASQSLRYLRDAPPASSLGRPHIGALFLHMEFNF